MFRRKEEENTAESGVSTKPETAAESKTEAKTEAKPETKTDSASTGSAATSTASAPAPAASTTPAAAARPAEQKVAPMTQPTSSYRPAPTPAARPGMAPAAPGADASNSNSSKKRILTVGNDILLKGEIATCDRLVIEGAVDAKLNDVHTVEIAETGSFKGSAQIEDAEISGLFEGDLVVRNRLIIYSTGKVRGKITYGEIEIERGGEMTGEIKTVSSAAAEKGENKDNKKESKAA